MATDIKKTYIEADSDLKRQYLSLFFDKFYVRDRKIKVAVPSKELKPLLKDGLIRVRVKSNWGG